MVLLIDRNNRHRHAGLMDEVHRFRHRVFVDHLGWEALRRPDGREIDQFDTDAAVHLVLVEDSRVTGYSRLLPTTGPHILSDVYPEILGGDPVPRGPDIWEWTRCGVAPERREGYRGADPSTAKLMLGAAEACLHLGIRQVTGQTHPLMLTRLLELGWRIRPLCLPTTYAGQPISTNIAGVDRSTLATSRRVFGIRQSVLIVEDDVGDPRRAPPGEPRYGT